MKEHINICFVTDRNYFTNMVVALDSLLDNNHSKHSYHLFIVDVGIGSDNRHFLMDRYEGRGDVKIEFVGLNDTVFRKYRLKTHVSSAAYAKIYISEIIEVDKVIYLDCDVLVNADISHLWSHFEEDVIVKAVWNPFYDYDNHYLGISGNQRTFNSGVMLLNLALMREYNAASRLKEFLDRYHDKTKLHDQAAFNAVFKAQWKELDYGWNYQVSMILNHYNRLGMSKNRYFSLYSDPKIIHFTSNSKPWQFRNCHPYKQRFIERYNAVFGNAILTDRDTINLLRKIKESLTYKYYYLINKIF